MSKITKHTRTRELNPHLRKKILEMLAENSIRRTTEYLNRTMECPNISRHQVARILYQFLQDRLLDQSQKSPV
ncbi:MAG: hypothetical protein COZ51_02435 [Candidatus Aquicultor secundus]|nr:MAG: hypothetical protein COZ51_02435 [Candidatus Aquicultor secundus]